MAAGSPVSRALRPMVLTRGMLAPPRMPLSRTPAEVGLAYEDVAFTASDGVGLRGWLLPHGGAGKAPAVVFVHGWPWNRLGNTAGRQPFEDRDVDFLPAARALHDAGMNVLLFDLRNYGESDRKLPLTFGPWEARDYVAAVNFLRGRPEVDGERIGAIGASAGGNTVMYGTPDCQPVKALLAVQPTRLQSFNTRFALTELGRMGPPLLRPIDVLYRLWRAPRPSQHDPAVPARRLGETFVRYVQGTGDQWGTMEIVEEFAAATPRAELVRYPSEERYSGYQYLMRETAAVAAFFSEHL
jgi:pimeloyl-ACP methyl ester carboxylesterase